VVKPLLYYPGHYDARHNRGGNIKQKVLHRRHLLVLKLGGCPADFLGYFKRADNLDALLLRPYIQMKTGRKVREHPRPQDEFPGFSFLIQGYAPE